MTRRTYRELRRLKFETEAEREETLERARNEGFRKRRIKRSVRAERHSVPSAGAPTTFENVPIEIMEASEVVHFPVDAAEIRELLGEFPPGTFDGIGKIQLSLGKTYMDDKTEWEDTDDRDPHTGRLSSGAVFPGIHSGPVLGTYHGWSNLVCVYAYVYDEVGVNRLPFSKSAMELYLRLHFFKTLIHEVAHHHDQVQRVARGRWLSDRKWNFEHHAERMEHQWTREYVIPFLQKKYPEEQDELLDWIECWGGTRVDLEFLAGDPRRTERNEMQRLVFSTSSAFEDFVEAFQKLPRPVDTFEAHLAFAWEVHYADQYELCLSILDRVLSASPNHAEALVCKADTLEHLERPDDAWEIAVQVLATDPGNNGAWEIQASVLETKKDATGILRVCDEWEKQGDADSEDKKELFKYRAIACCALDRFEDMERWIKAYLPEGAAPRREQYLRRLVYRRSGKPLPNA